MAQVNLSTRDANVLEKIKDPESNPDQRAVIDASLPSDPHVPDTSIFRTLIREQVELVRQLQEAEASLTGNTPGQLITRDNVADLYRKAIERLGDMVASNPDHASARNNRAQAVRRLYGDTLLVDGPVDADALLASPNTDQKRQDAVVILTDLERCVQLLTPKTPKTPISPHAARTLGSAHTQRAAIYRGTSRFLAEGRRLDVDGHAFGDMAAWKPFNFEQAAARDLALGARYGDEIAKALAVSLNPTAKLCGEIVSNAMRQEYGQGGVGWS